MSVLRIHERTTVLVPAGQVLKFNVSAGVGHVTRLVNGGEPGTPVALTGAARVFGPFDDIRSYRISCSSGELSFDVVTDYDDSLIGLISADPAAVRAALQQPLPNGQWTVIPSIYRLRLTGSGTVTIDARNGLNAETPAVASYGLTGETNRIEYPYFGDDTTQIRATLTGTATAEIL